jgi:hypothetical protein
MNIISRINEVFNGDVNGKAHLHINSTCRIAYVGYLREISCLRYKQIVNVTEYPIGTVRKRLEKHRSYYKFDKTYNELFNLILNHGTDNN